MLLWWIARRMVRFPLAPDIAKPRQKLCPDPLRQLFEFFVSEKASDSLVIQSIPVLPIQGVVAHGFDKPLSLLLPQEAEFMKALCKAHLGNGVEKQSGFRHLVEEPGILVQIRRQELSGAAAGQKVLQVPLRAKI
jgi:hypothetical protein